MIRDDDEITPYRKKLTLQSDDQVIIQSLLGLLDADLSPALQKKLADMKTCKYHISKKGSRANVVPELMAELGIGESKAYELYNETIKVFNALAETTGRDFWIDIVLGMMVETRNKAFAKGEYDTATRSEKNIKETIKDFFGGHEAKLYENLQPRNVTYILNASFVNVMDRKEIQAEIKKLLKPKPRNNETFDETQDLTGDDGQEGE